MRQLWLKYMPQFFQLKTDIDIEYISYTYINRVPKVYR